MASNANVKTADKMYRSAGAGKVVGKMAHHFHFRRAHRLIGSCDRFGARKGGPSLRTSVGGSEARVEEVPPGL